MVDSLYFRAGIAAIPVIGPVVSIYNTLEVNRELSANMHAIDQFRIKMTIYCMQTISAVLSQDRTKVEQIKSDATDEFQFNGVQDRLLATYEKGLNLAGAGIVGDVLTVALAVKVFFLVIQKKGPVTALIAVYLCIVSVFCAFQAILLSVNLYQFYQAVYLRYS